MMKNILVTGPPGCGKTTLIEKLAAAIKAPVTGFLTREIRERGKRVGFSLKTFDGRKEILAHVGIESPVRVGRYGVSLLTLETLAIPSLHPSSADILIVIDEIGKMECLSSGFQKAVLQALDAPNPVLASIAEKGDAFIEGLKAREDLVLHRIARGNRDQLTTLLSDSLRELLSS